MKRQNNQAQPKYILGGQLPENSIMGAVGTDAIRSNGISCTDDFVTEFAKAIVRYFKDNPDKVQDKGDF
ncbi:MAG: hypothetical protein OSJ74_11760 [Clostridia bacterium]|nr:hypothetical protein [Clostridia bacterium]